MNNFCLQSLGRFLINHNFCSKRSVKSFLQKNFVEVNGKQIFEADFLIDSEKVCVKVNGKKIKKDRFIYLMMNKPVGYVCSTESDSHKVVYELLPKRIVKKYPSIHCVGRLDCNTSGLLIFTNNGSFSHNLTEPSNQIEKKYFVKLRDKVCEKDKLEYCEKCKNGLLLKEEKKSPSFTTRPTVIEWKNDYECFITLTEGKFHEVRRIFETLGNCVIILKRISFYNYDLGTLKEGKIKKL